MSKTYEGTFLGGTRFFKVNGEAAVKGEKIELTENQRKAFAGLFSFEDAIETPTESIVSAEPIVPADKSADSEEPAEPAKSTEPAKPAAAPAAKK